MSFSSCSSSNSLFSESEADVETVRPAQRRTPPIPGLYIFPHLLPFDDIQSLLSYLAEEDVFLGGTRDQVMLFSHLSPPLHRLLARLEHLLRPLLPPSTFHTLFNQKLPRQVIYNLYPAGQGISPHVDLPHRYSDGIIGVSLVGNTVMTLENGHERYDVYLPSKSIYALTGESRWEWKHGIEGRREDVVESETECGRTETMIRETRVSITMRYLREGADVLS